jgi:hypothetical protein
MRRHIKLVLLLSAYAPALFIAGLLQGRLLYTGIMFACAFLCFGALAFVMWRTSGQVSDSEYSAGTWKLVKPTVREAELASFLLGYLLPFLQWNGGSGPLAPLALPALVGLVLFLNWNLGFFHLNPSLLIMGWRVVEMTEVEVDGGGPQQDPTEGRQVVVLCHKRVPGPRDTFPAPGWKVARIGNGNEAGGPLWMAWFIGGEK